LLRKCVLTSSEVRIAFTSRVNLAVIAGGMPAGPISPRHPFDWYPVKPDSDTVGTSGRSALRCNPLTPSALSLPVLRCGTAA
jgi:hypothetical protein